MLKKAQTLAPWLTETYQALHRIPEIDRDLPLTVAYVKKALDEMGVSYRDCAGGVLAQIDAGEGKPVLALRADMDALPVSEESGVPFCSTHPGKMHACGHDAHTTCALGALKLLKGETSLKASLRVLFQPAEETDGGAELMIRDGALDGVSKAFCMHVATGLDTGCISMREGQCRGASNMWNVTLQGRGSHGAYPHMGIDCVAAGAQIISALQLMVSRETNPFDAAVVTVGKFIAGTARNVIPDTARLEGIMRTMTPENRARCCRRLTEIVEGVASALQVKATVEIIDGYPAIINDAAVTRELRGVAASLLGAEHVLEGNPALGVDDFAYIAEKVPGCYANLGCTPRGEAFEPLHSPRVVIDPACLPVGAAMTASWVQAQ